jgi:prolyl-tRNA editing enzyme YbaK/EbsC (Cys-tRNA(Pro) deacylase)
MRCMTTPTTADHLPGAIASLIASLGAPAKFHAHPALATTEELRPYLESHGFDSQVMLKTLAFKSPSGALGLVTLRMLDKVDYGAVARALGMQRSSMAMLGCDELMQRLQMQPGAVCPFCAQPDVQLLLDERGLSAETIYCGSGVLTCTVEIGSASLRAIPGARVGNYSKTA